MQDKKYNAPQIRVLKGLEAIKLRPGMYTRTENPNHIIYEVIDNAQDEAIAGFANKISVKVINSGESVVVSDNGRGIPVDIHPETGRPAVELVFSELHSGGKFDKEDGGAYAFAGGLHGVGVSVTNALSHELVASVKKDGSLYEVKFNHGELSSGLRKIKEGVDDTGTTVFVTPDLKYFENKLNVDQLKDYLMVKSALLDGKVEISFQYNDDEPIVWNYQGVKDYLTTELSANNKEVYFIGEEDELHQIWSYENYLSEDVGVFKAGEGVKMAVAFLDDGKRVHESFVNLIPTLTGGTHERGLRNGLFNGLKAFIDHFNLHSKVALESDDLWQKVSFVLSAKILDPQFQGQTKEKLSSPNAARLIESMVKDAFLLWLSDNQELGKLIVEKVVENAQKRTKTTLKVVRKRGGNTVLPSKLADCEDGDPNTSELFLVEGDSAAGSSKMGRDKNFQAIMALRGKILNTWEVEQSQLFNSKTIQDISTAIGIAPHTLNDEVDLSHLRYSKICTMCDADVDGRHIEVLLITLFFRHFPQVIKNGHLYIAKAPLYRVDYPSNKRFKNKLDKKEYISDEEGLEKLLNKLKKMQIPEESIKVSRFKGLGEMNPEQLWETTLNPDNRTLLQVTFDPDYLHSDVSTFDLLMSKKKSKERNQWMEEKGNTVEVDA